MNANLRYAAIGAVALLASMAAATQSALEGRVPAHLQISGGRSEEQRHDPASAKFDAALADLSRHIALVRRGHELADLHAFNPAARFWQMSPNAPPMVSVDAVTRGNPQSLKAALEGLGLTDARVYANDVGGWLPVSRLTAAAELSELHSIRAAMGRTRTGSVTSQGDFAQGTSALRSTSPGLSGAGITVGILSDSFNCYGVYEKPGSGVPASGSGGYASNGFLADATKDEMTGDLPASVKVVEEAGPTSQPCTMFGAPTLLPFTDEGRAMMQIVHDIAPGASLAFYTAANSEADFAAGIQALATAGATVIADDFGYLDEPFYQDGILAQAVDSVEAKGVAYFSAAGNDSTNSYEKTAPVFSTLSSSGPTSGELLLNFGGPGQPASNTLSVTVPPLFPGEFIGVTLEWDQPYVTGAPGSPGASSQMDLCISGQSGGDVVLDLDGSTATCTGPNAVGADSVQVLVLGNPANASGNSAQTTISITIGLAHSTAPPGRIKLVIADDGVGSVIDATYATNSPTLQGHPGAAGAIAVGAAFFLNTPNCGTSPPTLEPYSSLGGTPILFDPSGNLLATPQVRLKPDVVGPDGVNDTFLGPTLASSGVPNGMLPTNISACQNNPSYPNFFGTSAAAPHVAAIAALMLQTNAALTPTQIYHALQFTAIAMGGSSPNFSDGFGFVQSAAAFAQLPPGAPTLTASASTVNAGSATTLTWSSLNTTGCTASGSWSGALPTTGSQSVTPTSSGTATYTLTCANAVGSAITSVMLEVLNPPHSSGGGAMDGLTIVGLFAVWALRNSGRRALRHFWL